MKRDANEGLGWHGSVQPTGYSVPSAETFSGEPGLEPLRRHARYSKDGLQTRTLQAPRWRPRPRVTLIVKLLLAPSIAFFCQFLSVAVIHAFLYVFFALHCFLLYLHHCISNLAVSSHACLQQRPVGRHFPCSHPTARHAVAPRPDGSTNVVAYGGRFLREL